MANIRVKDLDSKASFASDDEILMDSPSGTGTMLRDAFIAAVASQIVAAPSTYKIATLDGANKLTSSQDPSQSVSYLGGHDMVANSPALADGTGTAGDTYYVTNPGTRNYGSGNITAAEGDALVYSGSVWQLVEGIANILDGISTASTARTTLEVNSIDDDAQANALKTTAPALYFNGSSSVVTVADDDKFSFTDNVDDLPFSISAWVKIDSNASDGTVLSKFDSAVENREYRVYYATNNRIYAERRSITGADLRATYSSANPFTIGDWVHLCVVYNAAGPNTSTAFSSATQQIFVNGADVTDTSTSTGTYTGMSNTAGDIRIGSRANADYLKGSIRDVKIFNRTLTDSEVAELARGNDLGFSEEWGGALGGVYTSDFSAGVDGWSATMATLDGNIDAIGGQDDNLRITVNTDNNSHIAGKTLLTVGKRYRVDFDYYIPSGQSNVDGVACGDNASNNRFGVESSPTLNAWNRFSGEAISGGTILRILPTDGGSTTINDTGGDDVVYVRNVKVTEIGTLADFRSERFDSRTNKWYDLSDNAFVGTNTGATLVGREVPVYETGTWTPTFIGSTTSDFTYSAQEGYYMRIGNTVFISGLVTISALGTSAGNISVGGLPFTTRNTTGQLFSASVGFASGMAGLTSIITGLFSDGDTDIDLYDWGATGVASLTEANLTGATSIRFSGAYQIQ